MGTRLTFFPFFKRIGFLYPVIAAIALATHPCQAEDDVFFNDNANWTSIKDYRQIPQHPATIHFDNSIQAAVTDRAPTPKITASSEQTPTVNTVQIALPTRPLNPPALPAFNKGYSVQVKSTVDDEKTGLPSTQTVSGPAETERSPVISADHKEAMNGEENDLPSLSVRMSYLPMREASPAPAIESLTPHHAARLAAEQKAFLPKKQIGPALDKAACAAIDAYKKQQLSAIQSDRQTLHALQTAISTLGLQKQLDFMTGADGSLNTAVSENLQKAGVP